MYKKGDLQITDPPCAKIDEWNDCPNSGDPYHQHRIGMYDAEEAPPPCAYLPHSCDQWVIGGPEQIMALIQDLSAALMAISQPPPDREQWDSRVGQVSNHVIFNPDILSQEGK